MNDPLPAQTATVAIGHSTAPPTSSSTPDEGRFVPGTVVAGRYRVISLLGRGGMGEVYRATDLTLAQPVALKFLPTTIGEFQRTLERFHNEVRVARQVSHPNVCRVYDVGETDGMPYISMEYVDGEDLESLLHRIGRLPAERAVEIARKICAGVAAAHDKGVIHRDLKPANIMLDRRGNVVIMDFGLAAVASELTGAEARSGTPAYMAPEQLRGEEVTSRSDIYALGLVLYELFTGRRAYDAGSMADLMRMQESGDLVSMTSIAADIDPAVEKAIRRCLDPAPTRRPPTALAVSMSLPGADPLAAALAAGETPSPELVAASGRTEGLPLKKSVPIALGLIAFFVAVPFLLYNAELHSVTPMDIPPQALVSKIRDYAASFGYINRPADFEWGVEWYLPVLSDAKKHVKTTSELRHRFEIEPPMGVGYRESPTPLLPAPDGSVTYDRPAPTLSGMLEAQVNNKGELRRFLAVPNQVDTSPPTTSIDLGPVSRATGFDVQNWPEISPRFTPLYATDWLKAWQIKHPQLGVDVAVQVSAWHGRITELQVIWPWSSPGRMPQSRSRSFRDSLFLAVTRVTSAVFLVFSLLLAIRNLRAGRGDRKGAMRVAVFVFVAVTLNWACRAHWVADVGMLTIIFPNAQEWFATGAAVWLLYIALEPAIRARWPHALVTWSRVLAGNWRDPQVGAHVLYGAILGAVITAFFTADSWSQASRGNLFSAIDPQTGTGALFWIAQVATVSWEAVEDGLAVIFVIFCLRVVFRRDWIASIAAATLFAARENSVWNSGGGFIAPLSYIAIFSLLAFIMLRQGLLSSIIAIFTVNLLSRIPGPQNLTHWYEWVDVAIPAVMVALIVWAFWRTSGMILIDSKNAVQPALSSKYNR